MSRRLPQLLCALATAAALAVAGCGGDDEPEGELLPPEISQALLAQLEAIDDRVASGFAGACDDIYAPESEDGNIEAIDAELASIPSDVDPEIRSALEQSVERLTQLVDSECDEIRAAEQEQQGAPEAPLEEEPVETAPEETETTPTETTETPPPAEAEPRPPAPPDRDGRGNEGNGNGNGPSGDGPPGQDRGGAEAPDEDDD